MTTQQSSIFTTIKEIINLIPEIYGILPTIDLNIITNKIKVI